MILSFLYAKLERNSGDDREVKKKVCGYFTTAIHHFFKT